MIAPSIGRLPARVRTIPGPFACNQPIVTDNTSARLLSSLDIALHRCVFHRTEDRNKQELSVTNYKKIICNKRGPSRAFSDAVWDSPSICVCFIQNISGR